MVVESHESYQWRKCLSTRQNKLSSRQTHLIKETQKCRCCLCQQETSCNGSRVARVVPVEKVLVHPTGVNCRVDKCIGLRRLVNFVAGHVSKRPCVMVVESYELRKWLYTRQSKLSSRQMHLIQGTQKFCCSSCFLQDNLRFRDWAIKWSPNTHTVGEELQFGWRS